MRPLALLLLLATPAAAQDLVYDDQTTLSCLEGAEDPGAKQDCIGASSNACMDQTEGGSSTPVMGGCLEQEQKFWDDRLNTVYGELRSSYADRPDVSEALRDMQRAWISYRDARCDYIGTQWSGGTGMGPAIIGCMMEATAEQTLLLEQQQR